MKTNCMIALVIFFLFSCSKQRDADVPRFHVHIYKTNADYFNYINLWGKDQEHASNVLISNRLKFENNDTIFKWRWKLEQGYVADVTEIWYTDYFTNISFKEMLRYNESNGIFPFDSIETRIIDRDPFIEFYVDDRDSFYRMPEPIDELNEIIRNGEIEKYLHRLK
jgi:hypothetical protein